MVPRPVSPTLTPPGFDFHLGEVFGNSLHAEVRAHHQDLRRGDRQRHWHETGDRSVLNETFLNRLALMAMLSLATSTV